MKTRHPRKPRLVHPPRRERRNDKRLLLKLAKLPMGLARDRSFNQVKALVRRAGR